MSFIKGKAHITEGAITGTSITMDENLLMGNNKITGLGTDANDITDPTDAANKAYVDSVSGGVPFTITLTGTTATQIDASTKGSFMVLVTNIVPDGPSGIFAICKRDTMEAARINRVSHAKGSSDEELSIEWTRTPVGTLKLKKNAVTVDGLYSVIIFGTNGS